MTTISRASPIFSPRAVPGAEEVEVIRQPGSEARGQLTGRFEFDRGYVLHVALMVDFTLGPAWLTYSFHFQNPTGGCVFRYDMSPGHPWVPTFPHHKHYEDEKRVVASNQPTIHQIQQEVLEYLAR